MKPNVLSSARWSRRTPDRGHEGHPEERDEGAQATRPSARTNRGGAHRAVVHDLGRPLGRGERGSLPDGEDGCFGGPDKRLTTTCREWARETRRRSTASSGRPPVAWLAPRLSRMKMALGPPESRTDAASSITDDTPEHGRGEQHASAHGRVLGERVANGRKGGGSHDPRTGPAPTPSPPGISTVPPMCSSGQLPEGRSAEHDLVAGGQSVAGQDRRADRRARSLRLTPARSVR